VAERFGVWGHAQAHLTAEMRAALATKLLQREADTRRSALSLDAKFAPDLYGAFPVKGLWPRGE